MSCESKWETSQVFKLFPGRMIYSIWGKVGPIHDRTATAGR